MTAESVGLCAGTGPGPLQIRCQIEGCTCLQGSSQVFEDKSAIEMELGDAVIFCQTSVIEHECSIRSMNNLSCS